MGLTDFLNPVGTAIEAPGRVVGGALDMISQGLAPVGDALNRFSMSPIGGALARGAVGASGGMDAVAQMGSMQAYAAEQEHAIYLQKQLQQELEQTFKGQPFDPNNREQLYGFLNVFGKYFPEKLPDAAAKIHELVKGQQLSAVKGPNDSIYAFNPQTGQAEQVVAGQPGASSEAKNWVVKQLPDGSIVRINKATGQYESVMGAGSGQAPVKPEMMNAVNNFQQHYMTSKPVLAYGEIMRNLNMVEAAVEDYRKTKNPLAFNTAVFGIQHMTDPGSMVREAEFATIAETQSLIDRLNTAMEKAKSGGVTPELLDRILDESKVIGRSAALRLQPHQQKFKQAADYWAQQSGVPAHQFTYGLPDVDADIERLSPDVHTRTSIGGRQIPEGYEFTGEVDMQGNPKIRRKR